MELQKKLDGFRANFEADIDRKTTLDNEALRVKNAGVEERALKAGQRAPDFELPAMAGTQACFQDDLDIADKSQDAIGVVAFNLHFAEH